MVRNTARRTATSRLVLVDEVPVRITPTVNTTFSTGDVGPPFTLSSRSPMPTSGVQPSCRRVREVEACTGTLNGDLPLRESTRISGSSTRSSGGTFIPASSNAVLIKGRVSSEAEVAISAPRRRAAPALSSGLLERQPCFM